MPGGPAVVGCFLPFVAAGWASPPHGAVGVRGVERGIAYLITDNREVPLGHADIQDFRSEYGYLGVTWRKHPCPQGHRTGTVILSFGHEKVRQSRQSLRMIRGAGDKGTQHI